MTGWVVRFALAGILFLACALAAAQPPKEETLPAPKEFHFQVTPLPPEAYMIPPDVPYVLPYQRTSAYAHWQLVGVNRQGLWRARVIYSPYGPYYLYNGEPYLFAPMHQRDFMPYIVDSPNR